jgi:hypothetical protein
MKLNRHAVEVANPRPGAPTHISRSVTEFTHYRKFTSEVKIEFEKK